MDPYQFLASYSFSATGLGEVFTTAYETKVPNPNITWETATSTNFGFDLEILNSRLSFGFDYFINTREDILTLPNKTLPVYSGITPPAQNIGEFENKGFEITLGFNNSRQSTVQYNFTFNFSITVANRSTPSRRKRPCAHRSSRLGISGNMWKSRIALERALTPVGGSKCKLFKPSSCGIWANTLPLTRQARDSK
ncbi:MAG: TonB-dependent receptor [Verrucomicrobiota bacterium]